MTESAGGFVDRVKGKAKQVAGAALGNEELKHEGELHEEKADAAKDAARLSEQAEQERTRAEITARERELAADEARLRSEETAELRQERIEHERRAKEVAVERDHARREATVEQQTEAQHQALNADEGRAAAEREDAMREAERIEQQAANARTTAEALDGATDRTGR